MRERIDLSVPVFNVLRYPIIVERTEEKVSSEHLRLRYRIAPEMKVCRRGTRTLPG